ncbi:MAG: extracellular solute-binding protein [Oscillospiraceae bacterium]|nr:extracellular solute-binding protein [Oscillospiraceae bacterium]
MKKKLMSLTMCAALGLSLLAGCGDQSSAASGDSAAASAASAPQSAVQASAPEAAAPADVGSAAEASEAEAAPGPVHNITFPGSEKAELDYQNEVSLPISEDGAELTMLTTAVNLMGDLANLGINNYNDFEYMQKLEELTGVHVETTEVNFFTASEQYNVLLASGDYPDLIKNLGTYYSTGLSGALGDDIIMDLTDDLSAYAPNYDYLIHSNDAETPYYLTDGKVLQFMGTYDSFINNQGLVLRKDWLEECGLDVPETYDELHDVLKAFKDKYNCSSAIYMNNNCTITTLTEGYNVATYNVSGSGGAGGSGSSLPYYVEDGVVKCSFIEDGYRDYLTMIHDWYEEGLMDSDFVSIEYDPFSSYLSGQITSDQMGVWCTSGEGIDNYTVPVVCMASPVQNKGDKQHMTEMTLAPADDITAISVSSACEDPDIAMAWLDYWFSEDGVAFYNFGLEGTDYTLDESSTPKFTDAVVNNEFGLSASNYMRCRCAFGTMPSLMLRYRSAYLNSDLVNEAWDVWTSNLDGTMAISSNVTMTTEQKEAETYKATDIMTYANQMISQFCNGDADIDTQWDTFVSQLKDMGIEECIELEQAAYDAANS